MLGFSWFYLLTVSSSFDVTSSLSLSLLSGRHLISSLLPPSLPQSHPPFPSLCPLAMLGVQNAISPVSRLQFPHNPSSTDLFQAPPSPNSFQSASSPKVHLSHLPKKINPSQLTTLYRIDSQIKLPQLPSSSNRLRLRSPKPVLTVKPPVRRYGAEMPRVNPFATPVVSPAFHFDSFSRVCASPSVTHLFHVSSV